MELLNLTGRLRRRSAFQAIAALLVMAVVALACTGRGGPIVDIGAKVERGQLVVRVLPDRLPALLAASEGIPRYPGHWPAFRLEIVAGGDMPIAVPRISLDLIRGPIAVSIIRCSTGQPCECATRNHHVAYEDGSWSPWSASNLVILHPGEPILLTPPLAWCLRDVGTRCNGWHLVTATVGIPLSSDLGAAGIAADGEWRVNPLPAGWHAVPAKPGLLRSAPALVWLGPPLNGADGYRTSLAECTGLHAGVADGA